jgi:hypothetical protein
MLQYHTCRLPFPPFHSLICVDLRNPQRGWYCPTKKHLEMSGGVFGCHGDEESDTPTFKAGGTSCSTKSHPTPSDGNVPAKETPILVNI